jgi:hypothetical protein
MRGFIIFGVQAQVAKMTNYTHITVPYGAVAVTERAAYAAARIAELPKDVTCTVAFLGPDPMGLAIVFLRFACAHMRQVIELEAAIAEARAA